MDRESKPVFEFAGFRLDVAAQLLLAPDGSTVPLPSRAFDALRYLVERPGDLVEKGELMRAVWPRTAVEENNLSQCIAVIRRALGEQHGQRKFILTVAGRGFKFVAPVRLAADSVAATAAPAGGASAAALAGVEPTSRSRRPGSPAITAAALVIALLAGGIVAYRLQAPTPPITSSAEYEPLTDVPDSAVQPALSPDGHLLAFIRGRGTFQSRGQIWIKVLPNGESFQLTHEPGLRFSPTFTPDGGHVAYSAIPDSLAGTWETRTVPISGGDATTLLPNSSGLKFLGPHELMYSEFKQGVHLALVTSLDDRSQHRDIYVPQHERGMAHFSALSPDRQSVLVAEMGGDGTWQRCRVVPFDGSSKGRQVGPDGDCLAVAWSPDGRWMYFAAGVAGHSHLWRQHFPDGGPEQITFGPTDELNLAVAADGRSLVTSVGQIKSTIWLHENLRDRPLVTEGFAHNLTLCSDGGHVYYLTDRDPGGGSQLSRLDVATGQREPVLPYQAITSYGISRDERSVVFTVPRDGVSELWAGPLDRTVAPKRLVRGADEAAFDASGRIYYRGVGAVANQLHRINTDGSGDTVLLDRPILGFQAVSPDGKWAAVGLPMGGDLAGIFLAPIAGGSPRLLVQGWWAVNWSRDGAVLYVETRPADDSVKDPHTLGLPLGADGVPAKPVPARATGEDVIPYGLDSLSIGPDASRYVFLRTETWRNIYRIPLH